jgi:hypothetical protein
LYRLRIILVVWNRIFHSFQNPFILLAVSHDVCNQYAEIVCTLNGNFIILLLGLHFTCVLDLWYILFSTAFIGIKKSMPHWRKYFEGAVEFVYFLYDSYYAISHQWWSSRTHWLSHQLKHTAQHKYHRNEHTRHMTVLQFLTICFVLCKCKCSVLLPNLVKSLSFYSSVLMLWESCELCGIAYKQFNIKYGYSSLSSKDFPKYGWWLENVLHVCVNKFSDLLKHS